MTEAAQVLNKTNSERKSLGRSAYHKKNGSAVAKLGNKRMSWQEIQSKHGECKTYPSTDDFMDYSLFEELPSDLKIEFVNKMMDKYDISLSQISQFLFNKGGDGLKANLRNKFDILDKTDYRKARANTGLSKFISDIEDWKCREKAAKEIDEAEAQRKRDIIWKAEFITFDQLKEFPIDGQVAYINNLIRKYSVSIASIASCLFQINQTSLRRHFQRLGVYDQIDRSKACHGSVGQENVDAFTKIVNEWRGETVMEEDPVQNTIAVPTKEESKDIARDILLSIVGEQQEESETVEPEIVEESTSVDNPVTEPIVNEPEPEEPAKFEIPEPVEEIRAEDSKIISHSTVFTSNYKSIGLDSDELDGLKLLFKNKQVEVCITVRTI